MTDTLAEHADPTLHRGEPLVEMENVGKSFGPIPRYWQIAPISGGSFGSGTSAAGLPPAQPVITGSGLWAL